MLQEYSIKKLTDDEWEMLRDLRLEALKTDPGVFTSNYQKEAAYSKEDWLTWINNDRTNIFTLMNQGVPVGITFIFFEKDDLVRKTAILGGSWVRPDQRNKGTSNLLHDACMNWATQHPTVEKISVSHRGSNKKSRILTEKYGLVMTHETELMEWPDGSKDTKVFYEFFLKKG